MAERGMRRRKRTVRTGHERVAAGRDLVHAGIVCVVNTLRQWGKGEAERCAQPAGPCIVCLAQARRACGDAGGAMHGVAGAGACMNNAALLAAPCMVWLAQASCMVRPCRTKPSSGWSAVIRGELQRLDEGEAGGVRPRCVDLGLGG